MTQPHHSPTLPLLAALACAFAVAPARRSGRIAGKPFNVVATKAPPICKQVMVLTGGVTITKGTMVIKADRVELREAPDGYRTAVAIGTAARPATSVRSATTSTSTSTAGPNGGV
jgi:lipopolysaccharide export system protein LptA